MPQLTRSAARTSESVAMELRASAAGALAAAALASVVALWWCGFVGPPSPRHEPPSWDADRLFRKLDADRNGLLDRLEFGNFPDAIAEVESEERRDGEVIIKCSFTPLLLSSMESELSVASVAVKGLLDWREPARPQASYSHEIFANFMKTRSNEVGTIWYMIQPDTGSSYENKFSNFRYAEDPPTVPGPELTFFHLLSMFHENVFLQTRFHPRGTVAMLQAKTSELFLIIFRCHAEFQLNSPPLLPFWFTPGQFRGQIIISRDRSKVFYFHLEVPPTKKLNVDMEWMNEQNSSLEVDIGYLPEMKLEFKEQQLTPSKVKWDQQISDEDAEDMLEKAMFPFKEELSAAGMREAEELLSKYSFPVTTEIMMPNGTVIGILNANDILDSIMPDMKWDRHQDPAEYVYHQFLLESLNSVNIIH